MRIESINIDSLSNGGEGVGRHVDGRVVFVEGACSGDRLCVEVMEEKKSFLRARIVRILRGGDARRDPPCQYAASCGGCQWQHVSYDAQVSAKREALCRALRRLSFADCQIAAAPRELAYRRRARLHWRVDEGRLRLGYRMRRSHVINDVASCPVLEPALGVAIEQVRRYLAAMSSGEGTVSLLGAGQGVLASVRAQKGKLPGANALLGGPIVGARCTDKMTTLDSAGLSELCIDDEGLLASATAFAQANPEQDKYLRELVASGVADSGRGHLLELFAGVGNLTRGLLGQAQRVTAVEVGGEATRLLRKNTAAAGDRLQIIEGDAEEVAMGLSGPLDAVVLDPPREGCSKRLLREIVRLRARLVVYVSCDPMTLARDLELLQAAGYGGLDVKALDMMPQTTQVEAVARLVWRGGLVDKDAGEG